MKLAIASDLSGFPLAREIVKHLKENHPEVEVVDFGIESADAPQPYFIQAPKVAKAVQQGEPEKGKLTCRTDHGMAIVATTQTNAEIIGQQDHLGTIAAGKLADLILVSGDPLADMTVFQDYAENITLIVQGGNIHKNIL